VLDGGSAHHGGTHIVQFGINRTRRTNACAGSALIAPARIDDGLSMPERERADSADLNTSLAAR
jgi:hypothetical protein